MKQYRIHVVVLFALTALVGLVAYAAQSGHGRAQQSAAAAPAATTVKPNTLMPTVAASERKPVAEPDEVSKLFAGAATRNTALRFDLGWAFGGKQQRGWHLYVPLITRMIETEQDALTPGFASALARWQQRAGLRPDGVLDDETLYRMVSTWQGARLKEKGYPRPDQLVLAPAADFYDPSRPDELRHVERETYAAYKRMVAAALADPTSGLKATAAGELAPEEKFLKIVSSFRSREYQARLRAQSPHSGRAGLAVNSPHFTGRALDLYVGGEPVETKDSNRALQVRTPVYRWLVRNADRFGFRPYYYEPWHWEYVGNVTAENK
ncbi:MAG TPA: M15 family metallopeptidase [Pyrinomonadaceae bacterium]|nr:M15 family metallopeptidase [Pyrinomonadaceae bacterium]